MTAHLLNMTMLQESECSNRTLRETCQRCNVPVPPEGEAAASQAASALTAAARLRAADAEGELRLAFSQFDHPDCCCSPLCC